jgi:hypothetical protein
LRKRFDERDVAAAKGYQEAITRHFQGLWHRRTPLPFGVEARITQSGGWLPEDMPDMVHAV